MCVVVCAADAAAQAACCVLCSVRWVLSVCVVSLCVGRVCVCARCAVCEQNVLVYGDHMIHHITNEIEPLQRSAV